MFPTDTELDARVAKGAHILDSHYPGWEIRVDLDFLDLSDTQFCVAAQVVCNSATEEDYMNAMDKFDLDPYERVSHGFSLSTDEVGDRSHLLGLRASKDVLYAPLTEAWKRLILTRLAQLEATR